MKFPIVHVPFLPVAGMALFPFILIKKQHYKTDNAFINHEKIHLVQQLELLLIGFYILYLLNYFFNLIKYLNHDKAYLNIIFEKEAYEMESDLDYLQKRNLWSWVKFY
jgi:hypothetical protein